MSTSSLIAQLKHCRDVELGRKLHQAAIESGDDSNIYVASTLVSMYAKCGSMVESRRVFDRMGKRNLIAWTALILGYADHGEEELALKIFDRLCRESCAPDSFVFLAALKACTGLAVKEAETYVHGKPVKVRSLEKGKALHVQAQKLRCERNIYIANALVELYSKCGSIEDARSVFSQTPHRDVVSWSCMMLGYLENGYADLALELFSEMQSQGCSPDARSFVDALKACTALAEEEGNMKMKSLEKGMLLHMQTVSMGCEPFVHLDGTLISMYAKCGSFVDAHRMLNSLRYQHVVPWTALISGYAENGQGEMALKIFEEMQPAPNGVTFVAAIKACASLATNEEANDELVKVKTLETGINIHHRSRLLPGSDDDVYLTNSLVDMYSKCGSIVDACEVFERMPQPNVVSWNCLISGHVDNGKERVALDLFEQMRATACTPNSFTFVAVLKACGSIGALDLGKSIHTYVLRSGLERVITVANALVDFYGKCGSMTEAQRVFDALATKNLVTWTSLISGYSRQVDSTRVFDIFDRMCDAGIQPNHITLLCVLGACSHAGLVDKGKQFLQTMCSKYGVTPSIEHYACVIDMLGRANQLNEAIEMAKSMPFKADEVIWTSILGACRKWKNLELGRLAFETLKSDGVEAPATAYVMLADIEMRVLSKARLSNSDTKSSGTKVLV